MRKGINNPHYEMTASDRVEYYQWARELEEKLQKQRELKPNDEPAPPPSDRGACQPAQKAADVEGECSHQASCHQETTIEKKTRQIHEIMRGCWEETEGTRHGKDLEVLRGHLRRVLFLKRKTPLVSLVLLWRRRRKRAEPSGTCWSSVTATSRAKALRILSTS